ncbi:HNH endonuclease [Mycobacterium sp. ACS1612]|uniref:HNH endonuclease n=1 Tax=Mycobacterium sp. ACS1612 TaxID=1834117 RepID=UPI0009EE2135
MHSSASQVDHSVSVAAVGAPYDPNNAQAICPHCNARKAQQEAVSARRRQTKRDTQRHHERPPGNSDAQT